MIRTVFFFCMLISATVFSSEADYVKAHCQGTIEYRLPDLTRIDCLDEDHAWEYDYGKKWAEAIGQSLHYASYTARRAGVVLIIRDASDWKGYIRAKNLIGHYGLPIDVQRLDAEYSPE